MRIKGLDFLRAIAIILVLFRHSDLIGNPLKQFGWLGVDLFFVLSGFLVAGILFKEFKKKRKVNIKRFLIRRGFKIYPPFYFFMLFSIMFHYFETSTFYDYKRILVEAFYLQGYLPGIWIHTWSLAVEEHFYILISIAIVVSVHYKWLSLKNAVVLFLIGLLILSFIMRFYISYPHREDAIFGFVQTHLRSDGIIVGILIAYLFHFTQFYTFFIKHKFLFLIVAIAFIAPGFYYKAGGYFMNTLGLTMVNVGFGIFTLLSISISIVPKNGFMSIGNQLFLILCFIGVHSYSIYLWHLNAKHFVNWFSIQDQGLNFLLYFVLSISIGIALAYAIEVPSLRLRDAIYKKK